MRLRPWCCAFALVLLGAGCSETLPTPEEAEKARSALERARLDGQAPYFLGPTYEGMQVTGYISDPDTTVAYGTCTSSGDGGCGTSAQVQTAAFDPVAFSLAKGSVRRPDERGVAAADFGGGVWLVPGSEEVRLFEGRLAARDRRAPDAGRQRRTSRRAPAHVTSGPGLPRPGLRGSAAEVTRSPRAAPVPASDRDPLAPGLRWRPPRRPSRPAATRNATRSMPAPERDRQRGQTRRQAPDLDRPGAARRVEAGGQRTVVPPSPGRLL